MCRKLIWGYHKEPLMNVQGMHLQVNVNAAEPLRRSVWSVKSIYGMGVLSMSLSTRGKIEKLTALEDSIKRIDSLLSDIMTYNKFTFLSKRVFVLSSSIHWGKKEEKLTLDEVGGLYKYLADKRLKQVAELNSYLDTMNVE